MRLARSSRRRPIARTRGDEQCGAGIDLTGEFMEADRSWSELDDDGMVVHRNTRP